MEDLRRKKRVDENGEWEFECIECLKWLPKKNFSGCVEYIDPYGNCIMCRSCISRKSQHKRVDNEKKLVMEILIGMDYDLDSTKSVHQQFIERITEKYGYTNNNRTR